jgi:dienelactone hydrolase
MFSPRAAEIWVVFAVGLLAGGCAAPERAGRTAAANPPQVPVTLRVDTREGAFDYDLYLPASGKPAPLVVVAHGFSRSKSNMADWGRRLSQEGFATAVPTLPAWSDHARNGRAILALVDWLGARDDIRGSVDTKQVGLVGFSAGGLATLLAAADTPNVGVWVGLDPVDMGGQGVRAAASLKCPSLVLRAEPQPANANGNAAEICRALGEKNGCLLVVGAVHVDAEWPTDVLAEWVCGKSSPERREVFVRYTVAALRAALLADRESAAVLSKAGTDPAVKVLKPTAP